MLIKLKFKQKRLAKIHKSLRNEMPISDSENLQHLHGDAEGHTFPQWSMCLGKTKQDPNILPLAGLELCICRKCRVRQNFKLLEL